MKLTKHEKIKKSLTMLLLCVILFFMGKNRLLTYIQCSGCELIFRPKHNKIKFCSPKCNYENRPKNGKYSQCSYCKKKIYVYPRNLKKKKLYCSYKCKSESQKIEKVKLICHFCNKEYDVYASYLKVRISKFCSVKCRSKYNSKYKTGENSTGWKGGKSSLSHRLRAGKKWKEWRKKVFERDNYTCNICNGRSKIKKPIILHPHHIKRFSGFPELRFVVKNGMTVCIDCHKKIHKENNLWDISKTKNRL